MNTLLLIFCIIAYIAIGAMIAKFFVNHRSYKWRIDTVGGVLFMIILWPIAILLYWIIAGISNFYDL